MDSVLEKGEKEIIDQIETALKKDDLIEAQTLTILARSLWVKSQYIQVENSFFF